MCEVIDMCKSNMQTDELLDMISSIARKKLRVRGNLRLEAMLESTYKWLDRELKEKQQSRKRKWEEIKTDLCKRARIDGDLNSMDTDDSSFEELLASQISFLFCDITLWEPLCCMVTQRWIQRAMLSSCVEVLGQQI
ncbi:uncharacterized protein LOC129221941 isoform X2 [Uloborus diversus]|uniref:uncharacterized protein LOC129221941 isoform X2 n=1 Tax=Uloborus diversus TaxID=327109 RepID=UPI0024098571|nr:uncharacterized protein LOC129221941 isoform X2 [Uloborus diversus]XP_054712303.1 uncharacterized protein LOC129221941 isoform X2 [Uloborus diversus]